LNFSSFRIDMRGVEGYFGIAIIINGLKGCLKML